MKNVFFWQIKSTIFSCSLLSQLIWLSRCCIIHIHRELKCCALILPFRVYFNGALIFVDDLLANVEPHSNALYIDTFGAINLVKERKESFFLNSFNTFAFVINLHMNDRLLKVVTCENFDLTGSRKLNRIFDEIDKNLLEPNLVSANHIR